MLGVDFFTYRACCKCNTAKLRWFLTFHSSRCRNVLWLQHQFGIQASDGIMARAASAADDGDTIIPEWVLDVPEVTDAQVWA
jgi:hypothetical protein